MQLTGRFEINHHRLTGQALVVNNGRWYVNGRAAAVSEEPKCFLNCYQRAPEKATARGRRFFYA
jgi:hypothetical protein